MDTAPGYVNVLQCIVKTINGVCMTQKELQTTSQNHTSITQITSLATVNKQNIT